MVSRPPVVSWGRRAPAATPSPRPRSLAPPRPVPRSVLRPSRSVGSASRAPRASVRARVRVCRGSRALVRAVGAPPALISPMRLGGVFCRGLVGLGSRGGVLFPRAFPLARGGVRGRHPFGNAPALPRPVLLQPTLCKCPLPAPPPENLTFSTIRTHFAPRPPLVRPSSACAPLPLRLADSGMFYKFALRSDIGTQL